MRLQRGGQAVIGESGDVVRYGENTVIVGDNVIVIKTPDTSYIIPLQQVLFIIEPRDGGSATIVLRDFYEFHVSEGGVEYSYVPPKVHVDTGGDR